MSIIFEVFWRAKDIWEKPKKVVIIYEVANSTGSFFTLLPSVCWLMNLPNLNCVTIQRLLIWWLCLVSMWQRFKPNIFFSHFKPFSLFSQQHDFSFSTGITEDAKYQVYLLSLEWCHWCFTLKKREETRRENFVSVKYLCGPQIFAKPRASEKKMFYALTFQYSLQFLLEI